MYRSTYIEINNKQEGGIHYDERGKANGYGKQTRCHAEQHKIHYCRRDNAILCCMLYHDKTP